jgi:hypothetical protein
MFDMYSRIMRTELMELFSPRQGLKVWLPEKAEKWRSKNVTMQEATWISSYILSFFFCSGSTTRAASQIFSLALTLSGRWELYGGFSLGDTRLFPERQRRASRACLGASSAEVEYGGTPSEEEEQT